MDRLLGKKIIRPEAEAVRKVTGFSIGGVPPIVQNKRLRTLVDEDLLNFSLVYASAGIPNAVFAVSPRDLISITKAEVVYVKE